MKLNFFIYFHNILRQVEYQHTCIKDLNWEIYQKLKQNFVFLLAMHFLNTIVSHLDNMIFSLKFYKILLFQWNIIRYSCSYCSSASIYGDSWSSNIYIWNQISSSRTYISDFVVSRCLFISCFTSSIFTIVFCPYNDPLDVG